MTNTFIVEEHHEAYLVWKFAVLNKLIPPKNNTLLHLDEHGDMGMPKLNIALNSLGTDIKTLAEFTYSELNIENFIVPAIYEGIFRDIIWIKQRHIQPLRRGHWFEIISVRANGQRLIKQPLAAFIPSSALRDDAGDDSAKYRFYKKHVNEIPALKHVCLDIDLDFFSCDQDPLSTCHKIEITQAEYLRHLETPYNRLRFFEFGRVDVLHESGRYYYLLNNYTFADHSGLKVDEKTILLRISDAVNRLILKKIRPGIITICRSRYSGYTPVDQWEFIERELLKKLELAFGPLKIRHIGDITRELV